MELNLSIETSKTGIDLLTELGKITATGAIYQEIKRRMHAAAREYLLGAETDADKLDRASRLYWNCPSIPAKLIAEVLWGDEKLGKDLPAWLGATAFCACEYCGIDVLVKNRSQRDYLKASRNSGITIVCPACCAQDQEQEAANRKANQVAAMERREELRTMPYREYLLTEEWQETRLRKLRQAGFRCQLCNQRGLLNVHHRTYERRGEEEMGDLTVLCQPCHGKFHDKIPTETA